MKVSTATASLYATGFVSFSRSRKACSSSACTAALPSNGDNVIMQIASADAPSPMTYTVNLPGKRGRAVDVEHYRRRLSQLERQLADALGDERETARAMADRLSRSVPNLCRERRRPQDQWQMEERDDL